MSLRDMDFFAGLVCGGVLVGSAQLLIIALRLR